MPPAPTCPRCGSPKSMPVPGSSAFLCYDCKHEFTAEKPIAPLRLFLSYGHDANEELVRRIRADLEKRGHDVWIDKSEIKFGDDWRRKITDGITGSQKFVAFLSKHSTRDPGVCRDEIAIALGVKGGNIQTILVETEAEVQPPVSISHVQWLDMHDWKERRNSGDGAWETWYQAKLGEIIDVVESEENRRFAGEIEILNSHLRPIRSDARVQVLLSKGFTGRSWIFDAVERWRATPAESLHPLSQSSSVSRLFWITGEPGVGKSAFAAQLAHTRSAAVIAAQFVEWDKPDHRDAQRVIRSLAFQLATRLPDYRKFLLTLPEMAELDRKNPAELFDYLLANPLRSVIGGGRERQLIVIDALDEAGEAGHNPLVHLLARHAPHLPDWLGVVVTSRPESTVQTPLQGLNPFILDTRAEENRADLRDYLLQRLAPKLRSHPPNENLINQILDKSEGVFLYVERFCDDVEQNHLSLDDPEEFPRGLGGIFCQWFQRQFPDLERFRERVRPALRAILAAREPLPLELLQELFQWQKEKLHDFVHTLGSLFPTSSTAGIEVIKPCHKALADWLADESRAGAYFTSVDEGHILLGNACWRERDRDISSIARYGAVHLPRHLAGANRWDDLFLLVMRKESSLLNRWIDCGDVVDGMFCLAGLANYFTSDPAHAVSAAAMATQLARIHSRLGDFAEARGCLEQAVIATSWFRGRRIRAIALHELASLDLYQEKFVEAASTYRRALLFCLVGFPIHTDEAAANLIGLGAVAVGLCQNSHARHFARWAFWLAAWAGDTTHQRAAMRLAAAACLPLGKLDECRRWLKRSGAFFPPTDIEAARAWVLRGRLEFAEATLDFVEPTAAVSTFEEARKAASAMHDRYSLAEAELGLAWCALACRAPDAGHWLDESAKHLVVGHNLELWGRRMFLLAAQIHQKSLAEAEDAYAEAVQFCETHYSPSWLARSLVGRGAVRWHLGDPAGARECWDAALQASRRIGKGLVNLIERDIDLCRRDPANIPQ